MTHQGQLRCVTVERDLSYSQRTRCKNDCSIFDGQSCSSSSGNVFVVSLAFADLVVAFYPYPLVLYALFHDGWALGNTQCMVRAPSSTVSDG